MIYDQTHSLDSFISAAAARQPTPGGGSAAALAGALAASMGEMVLNYSVGKRDLAEFEESHQAALRELYRARQLMLELMIEDQAAYEALTAMRKLPNGDPDREGKFNAALLTCIRSPQAIATTATAILQICERVVGTANRHLLSDLAVCAELAMATVRCASYNVRINLNDVSNSAERVKFDTAVTKQVIDASKIIQRLMPRIAARQGGW